MLWLCTVATLLIVLFHISSIFLSQDYATTLPKNNYKRTAQPYKSFCHQAVATYLVMQDKSTTKFLASHKPAKTITLRLIMLYEYHQERA